MKKDMIYGNEISGLKKIINIKPDFRWEDINKILEFSFFVEYNEFSEEVLGVNMLGGRDCETFSVI